MTVGRLAKVAGVGVETIRYYQGRGLLPIPKNAGSFRRYPASMIQRIGFIKRASEPWVLAGRGEVALGSGGWAESPGYSDGDTAAP
ncbi:MerR family transcriptional regulator [Pseudomonas aeruginosa]